MKVAVLALQGDFAEHAAYFEKAGATTLLLRQNSDLLKDFDAIILPGGESTVQGKLLRELVMLSTIKKFISNGMPIMATCAGAILLAEQILDTPYCHIGTLNIAIRRNAYGRQLSSFSIKGNFGNFQAVPMSFIRAPQIEFCAPGTEVLAEHNGRITAVRQNRQLAMTFHPELGNDLRIAEYFLQEIVAK